MHCSYAHPFFSCFKTKNRIIPVSCLSLTALFFSFFFFSLYSIRIEYYWFLYKHTKRLCANILDIKWTERDKEHIRNEIKYTINTQHGIQRVQAKYKHNANKQKLKKKHLISTSPIKRSKEKQNQDTKSKKKLCHFWFRLNTVSITEISKAVGVYFFPPLLFVLRFCFTVPSFKSCFFFFNFYLFWYSLCDPLQILHTKYLWIELCVLLKCALTFLSIGY